MKKNIWEKYYIDMKKSFKYPNITMYEQIKLTADKYPKIIAYKYFDTSVNYKTLIKKIDEISLCYKKLGLKKGDVFTICMPNTPEAIISFYALNKIGVICNMIHPLASIEEIKSAINLTSSRYILIYDAIFDKIKEIDEEIHFEKILWASISESMSITMKLGYFFKESLKYVTPYGNNVMPWKEFSLLYVLSDKKDIIVFNDTAALLYSGGTTGKSKAIELTNLNFNSLAISEIEINKVVGVGKSMLAIMPIFHGFGLGSTIHLCFTSGTTAIILPSVNPKKFDEVLLKYKPNVIACVPSILSTLCYSNKLKDQDLSFIKSIISGGDTLSTSIEKNINDFLIRHNCDIKVRTAFGMTECTAGVTMMPLETTRKESIGIPMPDTIIKICKVGTTTECDTNEIGEICISGPTVMKGYYKEVEETKNTLLLHPDKKIYLHSGDAAYMDEDGFIYFKSRIKRMIVSSGYNIYPSAIEEVVLKSPYVKECLAVGVPHPYKGEVIKCYIVLKDGIELSSQIKKSIRILCEKNIAAYSMPYSFGYRDCLPKTKLGKIAYQNIDDKDNIGEDNLH